MAEKPYSDLLRELAERDERADEGGGRARQSRHRRLGRLTAQERIAGLLDPGSFVELGRHILHRHEQASDALASNRHPGDGLLCGVGTVEGRAVGVYAHDPTVLRGALGHAASRKLCRVLDLCRDRALPVVALVDSDGVRVDEGVDAIGAYGDVIHRTVLLKGKVPQLTLVHGLCVGAAAYNATLTDAVGMVAKQSYMFITGPRVTKVVTGEEVELDQLGGPELHAKKTGACHAILEDERAGFAWIRQLLRFDQLPRVEADDSASRPTPELEKLIPTASRRGYDVRKLLQTVFDKESLLELSPLFAPNLVTAFARLGGRAVAIVASQPMHLAGSLDIDASRKGASFVTWAGQLKLPILTFVDVPGYLPGVKQESGGIIPHGATLLTAYALANVPRICLVVRKSYGGASVLSFSAQLRLALPTARVGPMGADAAAEVILGPKPEDPEGQEAYQRKREAWIAQHDHAWAAAESGYIDRIIAPSDVRSALHSALVTLSG
jgi:acetyl-CoA carboxylase carboxyltransferase component